MKIEEKYTFKAALNKNPEYKTFFFLTASLPPRKQFVAIKWIDRPTKSKFGDGIVIWDTVNESILENEFSWSPSSADSIKQRAIAQLIRVIFNPDQDSRQDFALRKFKKLMPFLKLQ